MWTSFIGFLSDMDTAGYIGTQDELPSPPHSLGKARCGFPVWDCVLIISHGIDLGIGKCTSAIGPVETTC